MYPRQFFDLFRPEIRDEMVFVGMSFHPSAQSRWEGIIAPGIRDAGLEPYRVDMRLISDSILTDIMVGITIARCLIFDITAEADGSRNGNVMYELGIAHATRHAEEVLVIRSDTARLLFDTSHIRVHGYRTDDPVQARENIRDLVRDFTHGLSLYQGMAIQKAISTLDEVCMAFMHNHASMDHFSLQHHDKAFEPEAVAHRTAIRHLLELGVARFEWKGGDTMQYAYGWTGFGLAVLRELRFRA